MTKSTLLKTMKTGRQAWQSLLDQIDKTAMTEAGVESDWSVKEIVAHIAGYEQYFAAYLSDLRQGSSNSSSILDAYYQQHLNAFRLLHPEFPERLDDIHEDQLNAIFVSACQQQSVQEVLTIERQSYERLLAEVQALSEPALTDNHQGRALIERIPNQCYAHYQMHMPAIEVWWRKRMQERGIFGPDV